MNTDLQIAGGPDQRSTAIASSNRVVVILGVHRSGTSLAARVLNVLGVQLGDRLLPGRSDNPAGFFEHRDIVERSRALDAKLNIDPFGSGMIVPAGARWWNRAELVTEREALKGVLQELVGACHGVFGFKDPRTLYLLPLWQEVFRELGLEPSYVLALRRPADTIASMMKRDISQVRAEAIWLRQLTEGLTHLTDGPDAIIHYERWFSDPEVQARELARALRLPDVAGSSAASATLHQVIREDLCHHRTLTNPLAVCSPVVFELYEALCGYRKGSAAWSVIRDKARTVVQTSQLLESMRDDLYDLPRMLRAQLDSANKKIAELQNKVHRLQLRAVPDSVTVSPVELVAPRHPAPYEAQFPNLSAIRSAVKAPSRPLKVCIATEDIVGPIRNGGIGSTYTHLAFLLAEAGHETTILYLRGEYCENQSIDYWTSWYAERGVRFKAVDLPTQVSSPAPRWINPMYAMFRHLQDEAYDLVHVSEWRGSAYFCLVAKRQGIAFRNTVFCVKSSSPWLWNRKHGLHTIDQPTDLVKMFAERRSIELADLVVGGSAHLLRWMLEHGYRLPENRTFVQPNVAMPADIPANLLDNRPPPGSRVPVREIVFFGRLEHRKGLDIFCEAINNLVREGVEIPPITFMGKFGARIPTHPELTVEQYIKHQAQQWPCKWQIIDNCGQAEALTYLLGEGRLAIMPSVIENSSLAVYETTQYAIPFIASDVGGTPELILKDHRDNVLTPPHPVPLSAKIREALEIGGFVAAGSFDNDANLRTWLNFHSNMAVILDHEGWPPKNLLGDDAVHRMAKVAALPKTSVCLVLEDDIHRIGPTLDRLLEDVTGEFEIILVAAGGRAAGTTDWLDEQKKRAEQRRKCLRVFHQPRIGLSAGRNFAASKANGDYLLFVDPNAHPKKNAIETFAAVAQQRQADILLSFYDRRTQASYASDGDYIRVLCLAEDPGFTFYDAASRNPLVYVRKSVFSALGGFTTDYRVPGSVEEFLASAILANKLVETVPEALADEISDYTDLERYNRNAALMRKIRPHIAALPLCYEPILMVARSLEANLRVLQGKHNSLREKLKETEQKVRDLSARPFPKSVAALVEERLPTFARRPFRLVLRARAWALVRLGK